MGSQSVGHGWAIELNWTELRYMGLFFGLSILLQFSSVQLFSHGWLFATPWPSFQASLSFTIFWELTQTHAHWVSDVIQQPHPLSTPSSPGFSLSQLQGLFQWVGSSHQVQSIGASASASVVPMNIQSWFPLGLTVWFPCCPRDSQESSPEPFKSILNLLGRSLLL